MRYIYNDSVGVQVHPYAFSEKRIIPAVLGAAALIGSGVMGALTNKSNRESQEAVNRENQEFQREMFIKKAVREDMLNANSALIQRQSLERAGLNPNIGQYGQVQTNVDQGSPSSRASVSQNPFDASQVGVVANLLQQEPLVKAQARKDNAEAHSIEIENLRQETIDRHLDAYFKNKFSNESAIEGETVIDGKFRSYNRGTIDAQKLEREWESRTKELDALDVQHEVDKMVYDERLKDSKTVQAIAQMPYFEKRKLYQEILTFRKNREVMDSVIALNNANASLANSQESLNVLQEEIQRNSNLAELIHKYLGDGAMADAAMFIAILLSGLNGNINIGAHVSKFKGKSESKLTSTNTNYNNSKSNSHVTVTKE